MSGPILFANLGHKATDILLSHLTVIYDECGADEAIATIHSFIEKGEEAVDAALNAIRARDSTELSKAAKDLLEEAATVNASRLITAAMRLIAACIGDPRLEHDMWSSNEVSSALAKEYVIAQYDVLWFLYVHGLLTDRERLRPLSEEAKHLRLQHFRLLPSQHRAAKVLSGIITDKAAHIPPSPATLAT